jgi:hypothetical protein
VCKTIALLSPTILGAYNNWVENAQNPDNDYLGFYYSSNEKLTKKDLLALGSVIENFEEAYTKFIKADFADAQSIVSHVNAKFTSQGSYFNFITTNPFQDISLANRKRLLNLLTAPAILGQRPNVGSAYQELDIVQLLLVNTTQDDAWSCVSELEKNGRLFHVLEQASDLLYFGAGKFSSFTQLIGKLALENSMIATDAEALQTMFSESKFLFFDNSYVGNSNKENYNADNHKIEFTINNGILENYVDASPGPSPGAAATQAAVNWLFKPGYQDRWTGKLQCDPLDNIAIFPVTNITYGGRTFEKGGMYILPAVTVYGIFKEDTKTAIGTSTNIALNIGLTFVGAGALNAAFQGGKALLVAAEVADLTLSTGAAIINSISEIEKDHPDFVSYYNKTTIAYALARLGYAGYKGVKPLVKGRRLSCCTRSHPVIR